MGTLHQQAASEALRSDQPIETFRALLTQRDRRAALGRALEAIGPPFRAGARTPQWILELPG